MCCKANSLTCRSEHVLYSTSTLCAARTSTTIPSPPTHSPSYLPYPGCIGEMIREGENRGGVYVGRCLEG